mmetsp:Transcript_6360/g.18011  ORF Transcript_6360/g.18011 Transcript_6360/m.18011 type:complete len:210 (-) Transcript_6360:599-1228(-)
MPICSTLVPTFRKIAPFLGGTPISSISDKSSSTLSSVLCRGVASPLYVGSGLRSLLCSFRFRDKFFKMLECDFSLSSSPSSAGCLMVEFSDPSREELRVTFGVLELFPLRNNLLFLRTVAEESIFLDRGLPVSTPELTALPMERFRLRTDVRGDLRRLALLMDPDSFFIIFEVVRRMRLHLLCGSFADRRISKMIESSPLVFLAIKTAL